LALQEQIRALPAGDPSLWRLRVHGLRLADALRKLGAEFGLSPASRPRLRAEPGPPPDAPFEPLLARTPGNQPRDNHEPSAQVAGARPPADTPATRPNLASDLRNCAWDGTTPARPASTPDPDAADTTTAGLGPPRARHPLPGPLDPQRAPGAQ